MWLWNQALQLVQGLSSRSATSSSPYDNRNRQYYTRLHSPARLQRRANVSHQHHQLGQVARHWADGNIEMTFTQDGTMVESATNTWFAPAVIQAHDLPRAMREGLYWTESNLDREAGYIILDPQTDIHQLIPPHITCARVYIFRDISREEPLWTAQMTVFCANVENARRFKFGDLTLDQIAICRARNQEGRGVYNFVREGATNINTIYDDMPLEGWWPWPKRPDTDDDDLLL